MVGLGVAATRHRAATDRAFVCCHRVHLHLHDAWRKAGAAPDVASFARPAAVGDSSNDPGPVGAVGGRGVDSVCSLWCPQNTATILGFATAALTIALQDFIVSFLGWFRLVGKRGFRVGDLVEINGVSGEAIEIGLLTTTLLETGNRGYRTGRRIAFMNSFAIRGQYLNFSTAGQWMWDELTVSLPNSLDTRTTMKRLIEVVNEETGQSARMAEQEWKHATQRDELSNLRTDPSVNLRPSGSGVDIEIRYVTRAWDRLEMRNRLYGRIHELLHQSLDQAAAQTERVIA